MTTGAPLLEPQVDESPVDLEIARIGNLLAGTDPGIQSRLPVLELTADALGLTRFETDLLALAMAVELDDETATEVSLLLASDDPRPTVGLALSLLPDAHWDALAPDSPLRSWCLIDLHGNDPLVTRRIVIDERVVNHLLGIPGSDARLRGVISEMPGGDLAAPSQLQIADDLADRIAGSPRPCLVHLTGPDHAAMRVVTTTIAAGIGADPMLVATPALPGPGPLLHETVRLVDREWMLAGRMPVIVGEDESLSCQSFLDSTVAPVVMMIGGALAHRPNRRDLITATVPLPGTAEQRGLWKASLGRWDEDIATAVEHVSQGHRLGATAIAAVAHQLADGDPITPTAIREACRSESRIDVAPRAQLLASRAGWDDLVLPPAHVATLRDMVRQVLNRSQVHESWGFADRSSRGLGVTALFAGESGTGKTLAAEVIANELGLDLYRIDLAATVSKFIGETEKNLAALFDAAESSGGVLLFDEADALFSKRTEVRDSHDRYANMEVSYLLQRMEAYRGLAILTTNLRSNLDKAFTRRLRFVVQFPFPDEKQRAEIWRRVFPASTPLDGIDPETLSRMNITGGSIWSIALAAAFTAADAGEPVSHRHILHAAHAEYAKWDRTLTPSEQAALL